MGVYVNTVQEKCNMLLGGTGRLVERTEGRDHHAIPWRNGQRKNGTTLIKRTNKKKVDPGVGIYQKASGKN